MPRSAILWVVSLLLAATVAVGVNGDAATTAARAAESGVRFGAVQRKRERSRVPLALHPDEEAALLRGAAWHELAAAPTIAWCDPFETPNRTKRGSKRTAKGKGKSDQFRPHSEALRPAPVLLCRDGSVPFGGTVAVGEPDGLHAHAHAPAPAPAAASAAVQHVVSGGCHDVGQQMLGSAELTTRFGPCCDARRACYADATRGVSKHTCDTDSFWRCLFDRCSSSGIGSGGGAGSPLSCRAAALLYLKAVAKTGCREWRHIRRTLGCAQPPVSRAAAAGAGAAASRSFRRGKGVKIRDRHARLNPHTHPELYDTYFGTTGPLRSQPLPVDDATAAEVAADAKAVDAAVKRRRARARKRYASYPPPQPAVGSAAKRKVKARAKGKAKSDASGKRKSKRSRTRRRQLNARTDRDAK